MLSTEYSFDPQNCEDPRYVIYEAARKLQSTSEFREKLNSTFNLWLVLEPLLLLTTPQGSWLLSQIYAAQTSTPEEKINQFRALHEFFLQQERVALNEIVNYERNQLLFNNPLLLSFGPYAAMHRELASIFYEAFRLPIEKTKTQLRRMRTYQTYCAAVLGYNDQALFLVKQFHQIIPLIVEVTMAGAKDANNGKLFFALSFFKINIDAEKSSSSILAHECNERSICEQRFHTPLREKLAEISTLQNSLKQIIDECELTLQKAHKSQKEVSLNKLLIARAASALLICMNAIITKDENYCGSRDVAVFVNELNAQRSNMIKTNVKECNSLIDMVDRASWLSHRFFSVELPASSAVQPGEDIEMQALGAR